MSNFLQKIAIELLQSDALHKKTVVLPNKRAGVFLKKALVAQTDKPVLSPEILSIQEFIDKHSAYQPMDWLPLVFTFYQVYQKVYKDDTRSFDEFIKWAPTILQDFNEIDAFGVDAKEVFTYINEVKKIEDWQLKPNPSKMITDYLRFYASLNDLYSELQTRLKEMNRAYQGMQSRYVAEHLDEIAKEFDTHQIVFAGFNALTKTEEDIITYLVKENKAKAYWDADSYYMKPEFEAGFFLRKYQKVFPDFNWIFDDFSRPKHIEMIGVPGTTTQVQAVAQMIETLQDKGEELIQTAVVLNEDDFLLPLINALPDSIDAVNLSLGLPVSYLPIAGIFEQIIKLYDEYEHFGRFHLDTLVGLIHQTYLEQILSKDEVAANETLLQSLYAFKSKLLTADLVIQKLDGASSYVKRLIRKDYNVAFLFDVFFELIDFFAQKNISEPDKLALVKLEKLFTYLQDFHRQTGEIKNIKTLQLLYNSMLRKERLAFEGEPLQGLQIVGMLETRLLDFDNVIITSMNEGVIPKGKKENSIIPFELRRHFGLPSHYEKNAVMAYHFYRLIQRAKNITLLYNTAESGLRTAEPSRFVLQLQNELDKKLHHIVQKDFALSSDLLPTADFESIVKTPSTIDRLHKIAEKGFSPSALSTYIRNPLVYYKNYMLRLQDTDESVDAIPANVFGSIIHDTMDELYKPFINKGNFGVKDFDGMLQAYPRVVLKYFIEYAFGSQVPVDAVLIEGKNLIAYEIIKKNIEDLIKYDKKIVQSGNTLALVDAEQDIVAPLQLDDFTVHIKGRVDRVDRLNGQLRIVDYKTGKVNAGDVTLEIAENMGKKKKIKRTVTLDDFDPIISEPKKAKLFQLLTYAWLYYKSGKLSPSDFPVTVGLISTRNIREGLVTAKVFQEKHIGVNELEMFEQQLIMLIKEIFNPDMPFVETDSEY